MPIIGTPTSTNVTFGNPGTVAPMLITVDRALMAVPNITVAQQSWLDELIAGASRLVETYCNRHFLAADYDEEYDGNGFANMILRQFPVNLVYRLAYWPRHVLTIQNTSSTVQRAMARLSTSVPSFQNKDDTLPADGLTLTSVASGVVATPIFLPFTTYPTIQSLADAVSAQGNGWTGLAQTPFGQWPSADLRAVQGNVAAANNAAGRFYIHTKDSQQFDLEPETGIINFAAHDIYGPVNDFGPSFFQDPDPFMTRGTKAMRVIYNAGFAAAPEDVQHAVALVVQKMFDDSTNSHLFAMERLGDYEYRMEAWTQVDIPGPARAILDRYRDFRD